MVSFPFGHSRYSDSLNVIWAGLFFVDMTATSSTSTTVPTIHGTSNVNVQEQSGSVDTLIKIHAILLAGSFLLLFPAGTIALRWKGLFKVHWILQVVAAALCVLGLVIALVLSLQSIQYASFDEYHQIVGIIAVAILIPQLLFGYLHHRNYKRVGRRSWVSHIHLWTGRAVILLGMLDGVL